MMCLKMLNEGEYVEPNRITRKICTEKYNEKYTQNMGAALKGKERYGKNLIEG